MSALKPQDTRALARGAIIAALYTALTVLLAPLSYGEVQIRFSEAFTLLPIPTPSPSSSTFSPPSSTCITP